MPRLKYPEMRMELLGYLRKLKDLKYQMKAWVNQDFPADVQYDHLDWAIHFIFDDTDLGSDARMAIGEILLDEQEASLMGQLVDAINAVFEAYGTDMPDGFYIICRMDESGGLCRKGVRLSGGEQRRWLPRAAGLTRACLPAD